MSILLEALKKSEAQRQLGQTPTLQTTLGVGELGTEGRSLWIPATMMLLAAVSIGWIGMAQFDLPDPTVGLALSSVDSNQPATSPVEPNPGPDESEGTAPKTPVMEFTADDPVQESTETPKSSPVAKIESRQSEADKTGKADATRQKALAAEKKSAAIRPQRKSGKATDQARSAGENADRESSEKTRGASEKLEPYLTEPISYWQLPQSVREDMPDFRITVLVYAEDSKDRFLLINGERLLEQEELSRGLLLEEIRRDRAIFSYRSYRFHVKG